MLIVHEKPSRIPQNLSRIAVSVDRYTLEKRRWRTSAQDGTDVAVDLVQPCCDGDVIHIDDVSLYFIEQKPETVIRVPIPQDPEGAAQLGWYFGNQHLQVEVRDSSLLLGHDPQLLKKLQRAGIQTEVTDMVFRPDPHSKSHHHH